MLLARASVGCGVAHDDGMAGGGSLLGGSCTVVWSSRFEPKKGQTVEGCKEFAKGIYETGIGGVKKRVVVSKSPDKKPKKPKKKASSGRKK